MAHGKDRQCGWGSRGAVKNVMTQAEADTCFSYGRDGVNIHLLTSTGRPRGLDEITWRTAVRNLPKQHVISS